MGFAIFGTMQLPAISIYNASAGAGKTFALVRNYLIILLKSNNEFKYRNILAITFTNKAVAEMKSRIIKNLQEFSEPKIAESPTAMFDEISVATGLKSEEIIKKSERILKNIVQDYASFDVVTIDNFTHRIIRTFAYDLRIPQNFEVELNTTEVLEQAVDNLIEKAGEDKLVTPVLLDYALEKTDDDKSWDISKDLYDIGRLLLSENDRSFLQLLKGKSLQDFSALKKHLVDKIKTVSEHVKITATQTLEYIEQQGLEPANFSGKYLPKALEKCCDGNFNINFQAGWALNIENQPLYTKSQKQHIKDILDEAAPTIVRAFKIIQHNILQVLLFEELLKKLTPLSVLQAINNEVQKIKAEKNLVLISDFNELINKNIAGQPTPFIYERLGERYQHYFIDEFQDTSVLQWENMIPLIDNAVSAEKKDDILNSLMLVGDPKQAIYRWRGGYAEQFIKLSGDHNPFQNQNKERIDLESNYRSYSEVINFNNSLFTQAAASLEFADYSKIYIDGNSQKFNAKTGGYVSISFVEAKTKEEAIPLYLEQTLALLDEARVNFALSEICILVRKNDEGVAIAQFLQENNIPVVSNESLLINQSAQVRFIAAVLQFILQPDSSEISIQILEYLALDLLKLKEPHEFYSSHLKLTGQQLFIALKDYNIDFDLDRCALLPLYEAVEYIIRSFDLTDGGSHIQFFLDNVFDYTQKNEAGIHGFLDWWEKNKERKSISTPPSTEAVQVMTIHKAKGLEFQVVIYPFAESDLYPRSDNTNWYRTDPEQFLGFETLLLSQKKELLTIDENTAALYNAKRQQQQLDNLNILYVALTRAVEQLYIVSRCSERSKPGTEPTTFADILINYLDEAGLWKDDARLFDFGTKNRISKPENRAKTDENLAIISSAKEEHNIIVVTQAEQLWDTVRQQAISTGNIIHDIMAQIETRDEIENQLELAYKSGFITAEELPLLKRNLLNLTSRLQEEGFFNKAHHIYNERDILYQGDVLRPDRVETDATKKAYLLDYKTGAPNDTHKNQISGYAIALADMGFKVEKKVIVYLNEEEQLLVL